MAENQTMMMTEQFSQLLYYAVLPRLAEEVSVTSLHTAHLTASLFLHDILCCFLLPFLLLLNTHNRHTSHSPAMPTSLHKREG